LGFVEFPAIILYFLRFSLLENTQTAQMNCALSLDSFIVIRKARLPLKLGFVPIHPSWWSSCSNTDFDTNHDKTSWTFWTKPTATEDSFEQIQEFHSKPKKLVKFKEQADLARLVASLIVEAGW